MSAPRRIVLLAVADPTLRHLLVTHLLRADGPLQLPVATDLEQACQRAARLHPDVAILDETCSGGRTWERAVQELVPLTPVIALTDPARQAELADWIKTGNVDVVPQVGNYLPVVFALVFRRIARPSPRRASVGDEPGWPDEQFAELLRHEVNNPLTGILGNAELLLARRDRMAAADVQRLETITELAVRLRETIRRITTRLAQAQQLRSA
ncbi:MAG: hypothetical protein K6U02_10400 [Firmicutes bacterium]|nr:hypothetical protein [Bacillota bacterium]